MRKRLIDPIQHRSQVWNKGTKGDMEYLVNPNLVKEEEDHPLEIDPGLLLKRDNLSWLIRLINSVPLDPAESLHFCIICCHYLAPDELVAAHSHSQPAPGQASQSQQHLFPLILVQCRRDSSSSSSMMGVGGPYDYYVSVQVLREIQVPIGDVVSHLLPHPHSEFLVNHNNPAQCVYLHPQSSSEETWHGETISGRCANADCERIFNNRQTHLRLYGITPQFCSISCKVHSWLAINK